MFFGGEVEMNAAVDVDQSPDFSLDKWTLCQFFTVVLYLPTQHWSQSRGKNKLKSMLCLYEN